MKKTWGYRPAKQKKVISEQTKLRVGLACDEFVGAYLRPRDVRPFSPKNKKQAQCVDIEWNWNRGFVYFKAFYKDLRPDIISETYDYPFARLEYVEENLFHLAFFRHTEKWWNITYGNGSSLEECFEMIQELPHFEI